MIYNTFSASSSKYDVHGREIERSNALGDTWRFAYDSRDNMRETVDAAGQTKTRAYDAANRLLSITAKRADATIADVVRFTYDAAGNILTARDGDSSLAWSYDGLNRAATASTVVEATLETTTVQPAVTLTNVYAAVGGRWRPHRA